MAVVALVVLVVASGYDAFTASSTVAASKVGEKESAFTVNDLKPSQCTMTVTSLLVGTSGGTLDATATYQLVLGTKFRDVVLLKADDCFVGGDPTTGGSYDKVTGVSGGGDQCIITSRATETNCTVVKSSP
jgi:hypothetical protein